MTLRPTATLAPVTGRLVRVGAAAGVGLGRIIPAFEPQPETVLDHLFGGAARVTRLKARGGSEGGIEAGGSTAGARRGPWRRSSSRARRCRPSCCSLPTKIAPGWPQSWATFRLLVGILRENTGPSRAIRAGPVKCGHSPATDASTLSASASICAPTLTNRTTAASTMRSECSAPSLESLNGKRESFPGERSQKLQTYRRRADWVLLKIRNARAV